MVFLIVASHQPPLYIFPLFQYVQRVPLISSSLTGRLENIRWVIPVMKPLIMKYSTLSCYFLPLRPNFLPRHTVLEHTQQVFFFQGERPSVVSNKKTQIYIYVICLDNIIIQQILHLICCTVKKINMGERDLVFSRMKVVIAPCLACHRYRM